MHLASVLAVGLGASCARWLMMNRKRPVEIPGWGTMTPEDSCPATTDRRCFEQFLVGWDLDWTMCDASGHARSGKAELLFSWDETRFLKQPGETSVVLGRGELLVLWAPDGTEPIAEHSTTRCFRDVGRGARRTSWLSSSRDRIYTMAKRAEGSEIVMEGFDLQGQSLRWVFPKVAHDIFQWRRVVAADDGSAWRVLEQFDAHQPTGVASGKP